MVPGKRFLFSINKHYLRPDSAGPNALTQIQLSFRMLPLPQDCKGSTPTPGPGSPADMALCSPQ
jgi:hypothetical protein